MSTSLVAKFERRSTKFGTPLGMKHDPERGELDKSSFAIITKLTELIRTGRVNLAKLHHESIVKLSNLTPKLMQCPLGNFGRSRRSRRSRCARQDGAVRWRQHAPRHRPGRAWLGLSGRSRAARACHLPASSRLSPSGTELVRGGHCPTRSCQ